MKHPYVVIGGGIVGSAIARELSLRGIDTVVVEKEQELGMHQSGRMSGVLHSGIGHSHGSIKARMCVEGNKRARAYCKEKGVPIRESGTLMVAFDDEEHSELLNILFDGVKSGVEDLLLLNAKGVEKQEFSIVAKTGILSPHGAVVDNLAFLNAVAKDAMDAGTRYFFGEEVGGITDDLVITTKGEIGYSHIINCAGLHADEVAHMMGVGMEYRVIPFRGGYYELPDAQIRSMVYRVPDRRFPFKGAHYVRSIDDRVLVGPHAALAMGKESYDGEVPWKEAGEIFSSMTFWKLMTHKDFFPFAMRNAYMSFSKGAFLSDARKMNPWLDSRNARPYRAGIRAQLVKCDGTLVDDMLVEYQERSTHILNAVSPGFTASLAFAEHVVDNILIQKK